MNLLIIFCAQYLIVFVVIALIVALFRVDMSNKKRLIVATILAGGIAFVIAQIASHVYFDPRPFVGGHVKPLIKHAADNGFPSDHALFTMTVTAVVYFFHKKIAGVMLIMTILVGVARVLAHVHSPIDIIAGWAFGIIGAIVGYYISRFIFNRYATQATANTSVDD